MLHVARLKGYLPIGLPATVSISHASPIPCVAYVVPSRKWQATETSQGQLDVFCEFSNLSLLGDLLQDHTCGAS